MAYTFIDLFSGAGGLTSGFVREGLTPVLAVEIDADAADTYRTNFGDHVVGDPIENVPLSVFPRADVVIGGPPCQGFSPLGKMTGARSNLALNGLWEEYARVVEKVQPKVFVLENVPEFLKSLEFEALQRFAQSLGYEVAADVLNATHFGVPQKRRRAVVIASKGTTPWMPITVSNAVPTVAGAIGQLPPPEGRGEQLGSGRVVSGLELHFLRNPKPSSIERYKCVPPGGNRFDLMRKAPQLAPRCWIEKPTGSTDVFGRLRWDEPALTIRTEFFKPEKGRYLHPEQDRSISHLEAALLQTFDLDYRWLGTKISVARQIGNAVPPRLAAAIARVVVQLLSGATAAVGSDHEASESSRAEQAGQRSCVGRSAEETYVPV